MKMSHLYRRHVRQRILVAGLIAIMSITFLTGIAQCSSTTDFSGSNAYALLQTLARDIGPRPMGSPAEKRALDFAVSKFKEYGCDTAYIIPMAIAGGVNTSSGVAVGIARGRTGRMVVLGSHIDSASPEIPGANDNGSGTACVIELARVLAPRDMQSTLVFCCFGGEEEGLRGSKRFVETFPLIDSVALMIQLDMADGASFLELDPDAAFQVSAPRWLPEAAVEIYYDSLGLRNLVYSSHFATLNGSTPGGTGSDHIPFLEKGIPAIDFTSDANYPIHSQLDNLSTFDSSGLAHSGLLAQRLAERFDGGCPTRSTEKYYLLQIGKTLVFVDYWLLYALHALTFVVALVTVIRLRRNRIRDKSTLPRWSALKLFVGVLIVQLCIWTPDSIMGVISGYRYPWVNNFGGYVVLALLCGAAGFWMALRWLRRVKTTPDPYPYFVRSFVLLVAVTAALLLANPEIALYTGVPLLFLSLAALVRHPVVKGALALASLYLPLHMLFPEYLGLFQRSMSGTDLSVWWQRALIDLGFILITTPISLLFTFGFASVWKSAQGDLFWLRGFTGNRTWAVLAPAILVTAIVLLTRPVYDAQWQPSVRAEQRFEIGADTSSLQIKGSESLEGMRIAIAGRDTLLSGRVSRFTPSLGPGSSVRWLTVHCEEEVMSDTLLADSSQLVRWRVKLIGDRRPLLVELRFRSDKDFDLKSPWSVGARRSGEPQSKTGRTLTWYAFPDSILDIPVTLTMKPDQKVIQSLSVTYTGLAAPVTLDRGLTMMTLRTVVTKTDTITIDQD
jgi:hypothetical protein